MIHAYSIDNDRLRRADVQEPFTAEQVWFDLVSPTPQEEKPLEALLGVDLPTREEMLEIEATSRLYAEDGGLFLTALLPANTDSDTPIMEPVTFVLAKNRLVTIRYHEPQVFKTFPQRVQKTPLGCRDGLSVLVALLEAVVDRLADVLERAGREIDVISRSVFSRDGAKARKGTSYQTTLEEIGRKGDLASNIRDSLATLERLVGYLGQRLPQQESVKEMPERIAALTSDIRSLSDHLEFMAQKVTFLLDATLGLIGIEQNAIIKIFSVAAVVFLPPTLVASIYGMNFEFMPELGWRFGYPFAILLMILSAVLPYLYFKRRGWL
jgi:magnesium transporter